MTARRWIAALLFVVVAAAGAYWYSPRQTLNSLQAAMVEQDVVALERYVDWARVREGLRADITGALAANAARDVRGDSAGAAVGSVLAAALAPTVVGFLGDQVISPRGALIVAGHRERVDGRKLSLTVERMEFTALDEFTVWVRWPDEPALARAILVREGASWRVVRVVAPFEFLAGVVRKG